MAHIEEAYDGHLVVLASREIMDHFLEYMLIAGYKESKKIYIPT